MTAEIALVKASFTSRQMHISDIWLESCIKWCKQEILGPHYTLKDLEQEVCHQWLLLDLCEAEVGVLPPNLSNQVKYTLNGNFCLQILQLVDISKPKLWQLHKIRNSNALTRGTQQDGDVAGTGKRLLQMRLTDGVQEIEAMEYKPINCLSLNITPGTKVRIKGPVMVRRGRLMLEEKNLIILGGEVDRILVSNAAENVLARFLNLPENPNPGAIEEKILTVETGEARNLNPELNSNTSMHKKKTTSVLEYINEEMVAKKKKTTSVLKPEDEEMVDKEIEFLMEAEEEVNMHLEGNITNNLRPPSTKKSQKNDYSLDDGDDEFFEAIDIDAHLDKVIQKQKQSPTVETILNILEKQKTECGDYQIKAKFKSVVEKLSFVDNEFKLVIEVEDITGTLKVRLHSDLIADFAECSASEMRSLKNNISDKSNSAKKIMDAIMKVKDKLLELDSVVTVHLEKNEVPVITSVS